MAANSHLGTTGGGTNYHVGIHEAGATTSVEICESLTCSVRYRVTKLHGGWGAIDDSRSMSKWRQRRHRRATTVGLRITARNIAGCDRSRCFCQPHGATPGSKWPFNMGGPDDVGEIDYFIQSTPALGREQFEDIASCPCGPLREEVRGHPFRNAAQVCRRAVD